MTDSWYPPGSANESEDCGIALSPGDYAWNVNFNNGNANWDNQDGRGLVRAVRPRECNDVTFQSLHAAWRQARRGKRPSANQLAFDTHWIDNLLDLTGRLSSGTWTPSPPTCFIATLPKAREIHAPEFGDRVVHHWLVPQLEAIYERQFIFDSFSNRVGKGTHAAVDRLCRFIREVHSGQGGGWYLQLDVKNFFNSIHRPTLYTLLKTQMERYVLPVAARRATHALLRKSTLEDGCRYVGTAAVRARVPAHKRLENAAPGCGVAIGNLSSQFFANVYLNELDQFVKHRLRAHRYLRYVDDFVLIHRDREQLCTWQTEISAFLIDRLRLELKADVKLKPLTAGCDFLGYVLYPTHALVRRRVVGHAAAKLQAWHDVHVTDGAIVATPADLEQLRSVWSSYTGHFEHANSWRAQERIHARFPWLKTALLPRRASWRAARRRIRIKVKL